jgi:outer membrane protein assembly factor BamB
LSAAVAVCAVAALTAVTEAGAGAAGAGAAAAPEATAVSFQEDAAHDGYQPNETLPATPVQKWTRTFSGPVSGSIILGDRVFALIGGVEPDLPTVVALDAATGTTLWSHTLLAGQLIAGLAYDQGRVFAVDRDGTVYALDAVSGALDWATALDGSFATSPVVAGGALVVESDTRTYGLEETGGGTEWQTSGGFGVPAVSGSGVLISLGCSGTEDADLSSGIIQWSRTTGCTGGLPLTPVVSGGRVYARVPSSSTPDTVLSASTGATLGTFPAASWAPATDGTHLITAPSGGALTATNPTTGAKEWSAPALSGGWASAPLIVGTTVYETSGSGLLAGYAAGTGASTWTVNLGAVPPTNNGSPLDGDNGLAAGDGILVVPHGDEVFAFGATGVPAPLPLPAPPAAVSWKPTPGQPVEVRNNGTVWGRSASGTWTDLDATGGTKSVTIAGGVLYEQRADSVRAFSNTPVTGWTTISPSGCTPEQLISSGPTLDLLCVDGTVLQYQGGISWKTLQARQGLSNAGFTTAIALDTTGLYGLQGTSGTVSHYNGTSWSVLGSAGVQALQLVAGGGHVTALLQGGVTYQYTAANSSWAQIDADSATTALTTDPTYLLKLHPDGSVFVYGSGTWGLLPGTPGSLARTISATGGDLYASTENEGAWRFDGTAWTQVDTANQVLDIIGD